MLQGHLWILKEASDWFCGKEEEVEATRRYITGLSTASFVLYGPPGSGKTYLVARVVQQVRVSTSTPGDQRSAGEFGQASLRPGSKARLVGALI